MHDNNDNSTTILDAPLTLAEAARTCPGKPDPSSLWRWCRRGIRGIKLEYIRVGRRIFTSRVALATFAQRLADLDEQGDEQRSEQTRSARIAEAETELAAAGI